ncbi:ABC transporter substrate-binding protein [Streptomyces marincola]|uniref:ABC transporter substrate-binding protein n=1 Tax=Streptomyces marincola TaxID=2878388 RepID=UPI001CF4D553|nr:ABC transporter substrate-binding protein [Streptomyces marincola]UCM90133.1 ABC transporter substrate-binding protein [Streptomyces marincola]
MRHPAATALAALALAATLAACGTTEEAAEDETPAPSGDPITLTDARGEEVTLEGPAVRVAGTEWNVVEYLVSLGVQPVGVSDVEGFEQWNTAVRLDDGVTDIGTRGEPSIDTLGTLDLDAVFVTDQLVEGAIEQIEETTPVIVVPGGNAEDPIGQMLENVDLVATATGTEDRAREIREEFDTALADGRAALADAGAEGATVAFSDAYQTGEAVTIRPFGEGSLIGAVLGELGFANAWSQVEGLEFDAVYGLGQTDVEGLTSLPDDTTYWYYGSGDNDPYGQTLVDNAVWNSLPFAADATRLPDGIWTFGGPAAMLQLVDAAVAAAS